MELSSENIKVFAASLPNRMKEVRDEFAKTVSETHGSWDKKARNAFGKFLMKWFGKDFETTPDEGRNYVFVEGINRIPQSFRRNSFFGSRAYPDAALILEDKFDKKLAIAIELDHGTKGSQIKNALVKGCFCVSLGFDQVMIFLFRERDKEFEIRKVEEDIFKRFESDFNTMLYIL